MCHTRTPCATHPRVYFWNTHTHTHTRHRPIWNSEQGRHTAQWREPTSLPMKTLLFLLWWCSFLVLNVAQLQLLSTTSTRTASLSIWIINEKVFDNRSYHDTLPYRHLFALPLHSFIHSFIHSLPVIIIPQQSVVANSRIFSILLILFVHIHQTTKSRQIINQKKNKKNAPFLPSSALT